MVAAGILTKDDRVELLDGEVYQKMPKGPKRTACIKALITRLTALLGSRVLIGCQDPVALNEFSELNRTSQCSSRVRISTSLVIPSRRM